MDTKDLRTPYFISRNELMNSLLTRRLRGLKISEKDELAAKKFNTLLKEAQTQVSHKFHFQAVRHQAAARKTKLFDLISRMPKGSLHHLHIDAYLDSSYFVNILKNNEDFWYDSKTHRLDHSTKQPSDSFVSVKDLIKNFEQEGKNFDDFARKMFNCNIDQIFECEEVWVEFMAVYMNRRLICGNHLFVKDYLKQAALQAMKEGFSNFQMKIVLPLIENHPEGITNDEEMVILKEVEKECQQIDPNFTLSVVFTGLRMYDEPTMKKYLDDCYDLKKKHNGLIVGFDIAQEESIRETSDLIHLFLDNIEEQKKTGISLPFVFHGGECVSHENTNVYDHILLNNCPRLGHGINLIKHPHLLENFRKSGICIETNPISNNVIQYVADLRMHPSLSYHNYGIRISFSSDDPGIFTTDSNVDFFAAAFSIGFDFYGMKRCCVDSIEASLVEKEAQEKMMKDFEEKWEKFLDYVIKEY